MARSLKNPLILGWSLVRAHRAARHGERRRIVGREFGRFGRHLARRLMWRWPQMAIPLWVCPVNIVRYFEFAFAAEHVPPDAVDCFDVSSPRLFSFYLAARRPNACIAMANPNGPDLRRTADMATKLGAPYSRLATHGVGVDWLGDYPDAFDCIWSISVIEHIAGAIDDREAVRLMVGALRPGGRLILTVPVDRQFHDEYRDRDEYNTQTAPADANRYFFQRLYDADALQSRIIEPSGCLQVVAKWFGEIEPGFLERYTADWQARGVPATATDPYMIAEHFREYESWGDMPGQGVVGLAMTKPPLHARTHANG